MFSAPADAPETKGDRTRHLLRSIALRSFRERGYDATTIRQIAREAGVSVGTTHYHFASKNRLVQELYVDVQEHHRDAAAAELGAATDLIARLEIVYRTGLEALAPYHPHAAEFVSAAFAPKSDINPLAPDSAAARDITEALFESAVSGASQKLPAEIGRHLAPALFVAHLLLALFWVYDTSPDQRDTRRLLDRGLRVLKAALPMMRLPVARKPVAEFLRLVGQVRG